MIEEEPRGDDDGDDGQAKPVGRLPRGGSWHVSCVMYHVKSLTRVPCVVIQVELPPCPVNSHFPSFREFPAGIHNLQFALD